MPVKINLLRIISNTFTTIEFPHCRHIILSLTTIFAIYTLALSNLNLLMSFKNFILLSKAYTCVLNVHLLLATQACFAYAFGKSLVLMQNRVPQIVSYHYAAPSYKVGITINGSSAGRIEKVKEVQNV